jgi:hypothetical protein
MPISRIGVYIRRQAMLIRGFNVDEDKHPRKVNWVRGFGVGSFFARDRISARDKIGMRNQES